jgi:hypothetical protein
MTIAEARELSLELQRAAGEAEAAMNAKLRCLLEDLQDVSTQDCAHLDETEANELWIALQMTAISIDAAQIVKGNFDWMDERSRRLASRRG